MKRSVVALALLMAALLPAGLIAEPTATAQPAALTAPDQPAALPAEPQPEWRIWPNCFALAHCPDGTLISCTGIPHGSKPICISTPTSVTCNGETQYCNL